MRHNPNTVSIPKSEIRDYMSVNTDDVESRFDQSKFGSAITPTPYIVGGDQDHGMFKNKVIKDMSTHKGDASTKQSFASKQQSMLAIQQNRVQTTEAQATRQPCKRFMARGNRPVAKSFEEHDILIPTGGGKTQGESFQQTYIDKDGYIKALLPQDGKLNLTM